MGLAWHCGHRAQGCCWGQSPPDAQAGAPLPGEAVTGQGRHPSREGRLGTRDPGRPQAGSCVPAATWPLSLLPGAG